MHPGTPEPINYSEERRTFKKKKPIEVCWFTILCQCQMYSKVIQLYIHVFYLHVYVCVCVCAEWFQPCLTLCYPMDCSPPGSSIHGIFQVRILSGYCIHQEYWRSLQGNLPNPGIRTHVSCGSSTAGGYFTAESSGKPRQTLLLFSRPVVWLFVTPWAAAARPLCCSPFPEVCPSSCPFHWWCHPAISSSDALFSNIYETSNIFIFPFPL